MGSIEVCDINLEQEVLCADIFKKAEKLGIPFVYKPSSWDDPETESGLNPHDALSSFVSASLFTLYNCLTTLEQGIEHLIDARYSSPSIRRVTRGGVIEYNAFEAVYTNVVYNASFSSGGNLNRVHGIGFDEVERVGTDISIMNQVGDWNVIYRYTQGKEGATIILESIVFCIGRLTGSVASAYSGFASRISNTIKTNDIVVYKSLGEVAFKPNGGLRVSNLVFGEDHEIRRPGEEARGHFCVREPGERIIFQISTLGGSLKFIELEPVRVLGLRAKITSLNCKFAFQNIDAFDECMQVIASSAPVSV